MQPNLIFEYNEFHDKNKSFSDLFTIHSFDSNSDKNKLLRKSNQFDNLENTQKMKKNRLNFNEIEQKQTKNNEMNSTEGHSQQNLIFYKPSKQKFEKRKIETSFEINRQKSDKNLIKDKQNSQLNLGNNIWKQDEDKITH